MAEFLPATVPTWAVYLPELGTVHRTAPVTAWEVVTDPDGTERLEPLVLSWDVLRPLTEVALGPWGITQGSVPEALADLYERAARQLWHRCHEDGWRLYDSDGVEVTDPADVLTRGTEWEGLETSNMGLRGLLYEALGAWQQFASEGSPAHGVEALRARCGGVSDA